MNMGHSILSVNSIVMPASFSTKKPSPSGENPFLKALSVVFLGLLLPF